MASSTSNDEWNKMDATGYLPDERKILQMRVLECRRRGWWTHPSTWMPCSESEEGAVEDVPRLLFFEDHGWDMHDKE